MTPGASEETADGVTEGKIDQIIELMRYERYRFSPARRIDIPTKNGKLRPAEPLRGGRRDGQVPGGW
jgi:retron-type reverse transcriptase